MSRRSTGGAWAGRPGCSAMRCRPFSDACRALGGAPIPGADAGFELPVIGPYRIRILLWAGDDEFPASAQILYSDQFTCGFTAEDSVVAAELLLDSLCGQLPRK